MRLTFLDLGSVAISFETLDHGVLLFDDNVLIVDGEMNFLPNTSCLQILNNIVIYKKLDLIGN